MVKGLKSHSKDGFLRYRCWNLHLSSRVLFVFFWTHVARIYRTLWIVRNVQLWPELNFRSYISFHQRYMNQRMNGMVRICWFSFAGADANVCPQGYFCPQGTSAPVACPKGSYSNLTGLTASVECADCPEGQYCAEVGRTSPTGLCDAG